MTRLLTVLSVLFLILTSQTVLACSCIGKSTVKKGYKNADVVISGRILSTETEWLPDSIRIQEMTNMDVSTDSLEKISYGVYLKKVLVKINTVYKGKAINDTLTIYTGTGGGDCGFRFIEGQNYIIYGNTDCYLGFFSKEVGFPSGQNIYWTNICTRTQKYNEQEITDIEKIHKKR